MLAVLLAQLLERHCPGRPGLGQPLGAVLAAAGHGLWHFLENWCFVAPAPAHGGSNGGDGAAEGSLRRQQWGQHPLASGVLATFLLRDAPELLWGALERQQGARSRQRSGARPQMTQSDAQHFQRVCGSLMGAAQYQLRAS